LQGDQHDGVMNYRWRRLVQEWVMNPNSKVDGLVKGLRSIERDYPSAVQNSLLNVLSSHDTERLSTRLKGDESQIRIATALQFFLPGVPCIYYGDEIGLAGGHDPLCRGTMIWDRQNWNLERFNWYQELVRLRQNKPSLQFGKLVERTDSHGLLVLERTQKSDWSRLYVNRTLSSREIRLPKENATVLGYLAKQESGQLVIAAGGVALVGNRTRRPKLVDSDKS
jgi:glycosidase